MGSISTTTHSSTVIDPALVIGLQLIYFVCQVFTFLPLGIGLMQFCNLSIYNHSGYIMVQGHGDLFHRPVISDEKNLRLMVT